ncbi:MAG: phosphatidylserine/phosphatidylglycerophosphate/cardiolipin synthase family protein [Ignavibacteriae bacterium]|nr:phosphatidylserine/phosphatidylglycerophosphate/cardiolipin synthase family protein [Ignavibacteriota bacterium]
MYDIALHISRGHPILSPEFERETDRLTHTVIREGNAVTLLPSGVESYQKRWELIENATNTIHIVAFSLMRDETSYRLRDMIVKKEKESVNARLIFDDGVMYSTFSGGILRSMVKGGAESIRYHSMFRNLMPDLKSSHPFLQFKKNLKTKLRRHFHEKYMVIDGREAILGGINWGNKYAYGGIEVKAWRDTDVYLAGPIVSDIQRRFIKDFFLYRAMAQGKYKCDTSLEKLYENVRNMESEFINKQSTVLFPMLNSTGPYRVRYISHKPYDEQRLPITNAYLQMFRAARHYIFWGCHGIRPPRIIAEALADAVQRGVEVRLITNSRKASRTLMLNGLMGWMYWESSNHFRRLIQNGVKVFEWQKPGAFHSKNLVIDDVVASVGSYNIASGSTFYHTESNVIIYNQEFAEHVRRQFEIDLHDCREITIENAKVVSSKHDPFLRPLDERTRWVDPSLLPDSIRNELHIVHDQA